MASIEPKLLIYKESGKVVEQEIGIYTNDDIPENVEIDFLTEDEIVDDLLNRVLSGEDKEQIKESSVESLNALANSVGSFIRNNYGLWLKPHPYAVRKTSDEKSAENISKEIIEKMKKRLA